MADNGWTSRLREQPPEDWPAFLTENSGLPGPRANLTLVAAAATTAEPDTIAILLEDGGEYTAMCAAAALAHRADDPAVEVRARTRATDERWRVREGVAIGLQLLGDQNPGALVRIVEAWIEDTHPLVQRAALAAICEPRLLREPATAVAALDACQRATAAFVALPTARRTDQDARSLRQALAYCWSIAVAAQPREGIDESSALDAADPDVAWIIAQNRRKKRLASLL
ncbi:HEAT repeat domain-containing protein [Microbacterium sp. 179-I 3D4 NHS]|uniref:HEAT repeat domain-containing protein n=1 Tax=Microbacterium sp. 179-I 3D4 NHS TaxID=3142381 RepID=UPI0039A22CF6